MKKIFIQLFKTLKIAKKLKNAGLDEFLALLLMMVLLAFLWPAPGSAGDTLSLKNAANWGISVIFFFYGLRLSRAKLKEGLNNRRLHVVVHLSTFIFFPALIMLVKPLFRGEENELLWLGVFYLACLPSTVSSAVVMVSIAKGNVPAAIFNASVSSLAGVFLTPLLMSLAMSSSGKMDYAELGSIVGKLILQVLLPVVVGMSLNKKWGGFAEKNKKRLRQFDQTVILLIVYTSFCDSFARGVFEGFGLTRLLLCAVGMIVLFFAVYGTITAVCKRLGFNRPDTVTASFCGSKKSLVHGTAMSRVLFPGLPSAGIILLPIMLYHALQLMLVSAIARKAGKTQDTDE
jgi:sodium/bile acid cotransporter 7